MRKLIYMLLCLAMLFAMTIPVFAVETVVPVEEGSISTETGGAPQESSPATEEGGETAPHEHDWNMTGDTASCTAPGIKKFMCAGCSETKTEDSPAKGHTYGSSVKLDEFNHENSCTVCGEKATSSHTIDAGTVTKEATCKDTGLKTYKCTGCDHATAEVIPVSSSHSYGPWTTTTATHTRACTVCGKVEEGEHSLVETEVVKPTCKESGKKKYQCSLCNTVVEETLAMLTTHTYDSACDKDCNVCGKERTVEHTYTVVWSKNYEGHWHECTKCGHQKDWAKHIPGPAATEAKDQVCLTCSYVITPKKGHTHSYETKWTTDEVGHWYACKTCDTEKDYAAHQFDDACDSDCNVCSYKKEIAHSYKEPWQTNEKEHWNVCTVCGEESQREKHIPGPEATDEAAQLCTVCSYELAPKLEHTHDFGNKWVQAQESHWQECKCGELSVPEPHIWNEGKQNRDDTVTYTCTACGMEKTEESSGGFPWIMVILGLLALICVAGIVVIIIILKRGDFDEENNDGDHEEEDEEDEGLAALLLNLFHK